MAKAAQRVGNPDVATPAISSAILKVAPLTCAIGAEITNVNLGATADDIVSGVTQPDAVAQW